MNDSRKKIILNEILFWKQNKLLPEHYCDFLATLYSEGQEYEEREDLSHKQAVLSAEKRRRHYILLALVIAAAALLFVLFMGNVYAWVISIAVGVFAVLALIIAIRLAKAKSLLAPIFHIVAALLILGLSIKVSLTYFENNNLVLYSLLLANNILWLLSGVKLKLVYFTISGALGIVTVIGFSIYYFL